MEYFAPYDTSDTGSGNLPLQKEQSTTVGPVQVSRAQNIAGSVFADQAGVLKVQQSFDGENFDISQAIPVRANEGQGFNLSVVAPIVQLVYENGDTNQTVMRLSARTFVAGV